LKKPAGLVWFRFYKQKTKKIEPNRIQTEKNQKKTKPKPRKLSQTGKTEPKRFEPVFVLKNRNEPNRTETGRFEPVLVRF
jgi:hypothetical protein